MENLESIETVEQLSAEAEELAMQISQMYTDPEFKDIIKKMQSTSDSDWLGIKENQIAGGKTGVQIWFEGEKKFTELQEEESDQLICYRRMIIKLKDLKSRIENY